jgi:hypothetical protein
MLSSTRKGIFKVNAYLLSLNPEANILDQWDFGLLKDLLEGKLWKTHDWKEITFKSVDTLTKDDTAIVVLPARHHAGLEDKINKQLKKIDKVILFLMGDEEASFDISKLSHNNIEIWVQNPHIKLHDNYHKIGTGYPQHIKENLPDHYINRFYNIFYGGQVTHDRRKELIAVLGMMKEKDPSIEIHPSEGFTQGLEPKDYYAYMVTSKITPCPSGAVIPDSFRLFESLECMSIPVADQKTPDGEISEYWDWLFKDITPFPKVNNFNAMFDFIGEFIDDYDHKIQEQTVWWIHYKRKLATKLMEQING